MIVTSLKDKKQLDLPQISGDCLISVMIVDYLTKGKKLFKSWQWRCESGLKNSYVIISDELKLVTDSKVVSLLESELPTNCWDNFLQLVVTINKIKWLLDVEVYKYEAEYTNIPNDEIESAENLACTQFSGSFDALLSFERFLIFLTNKNPVSLIDKSVFLSGCGTGAEALVLKMLGAKKVVGYDIDKDAIDFAQRRFKNISHISFTTEIPIDERYDLIISRHVIEHIPREQWGQYFRELGILLKESGEILIDVPNQYNPREAHTEILFFHYLTIELRREVFEYCDETKPSWFLPIRSKMLALLEHNNVVIKDVYDLMPSELKISNYEYIDNMSSTYSGSFADNIRILITKS